MSSAFLAILRGLNFTLKQVSFNLIILYAEYFDDHTLSGRHWIHEENGSFTAVLLLHW